MCYGQGMTDTAATNAPAVDRTVHLTRDTWMINGPTAIAYLVPAETEVQGHPIASGRNWRIDTTWEGQAVSHIVYANRVTH